MKTCIVGAGAIGGFIGARLAAAGSSEVSALARGATLQPLRAHGWRLDTAGGRVQAPALAGEDAANLGIQDLVVIAVKGPALESVAGSIGPLLGPETIVLPGMNGVPWWFCGGFAGTPTLSLSSVDPHGIIASAIPLTQVLGCVVHASTSVSEPGLVVHKMGGGPIIGEPAGGLSARAAKVTQVLADAGFDASQSEHIRQDIWYKLWGNLTINPVASITGATVDKILADPQVRAFCSLAMLEAAQVGERIGCSIDQSPESRHDVTAKLGAFKPSMLQDVEAGRTIELDSIVSVVSELGQKLGIATPTIDGLLGLTRLFARSRGLYPAAA